MVCIFQMTDKHNIAQTHTFLSVDLESVGHVEGRTTVIPGQCVSVLFLVYGYLGSMCEFVP